MKKMKVLLRAFYFKKMLLTSGLKCSTSSWKTRSFVSEIKPHTQYSPQRPEGYFITYSEDGYKNLKFRRYASWFSMCTPSPNRCHGL